MSVLSSKERVDGSVARRFGAGTAAYLIGNTATTILAAVLAPVYTYFLNPEDYGVVALAQTSIMLFTLLINFGMPSAPPYFFNRHREDPALCNETMGTLFTMRLASTGFLALAVLGVSYLLCGFILDDPDFPFWPLGLAAVIAAVFDALNQFLMAYWRALELQWRTAIFGIVTACLNAAIILFAIGWMKAGAPGQILGTALARTLVGAAALALMFQLVRPCWNKQAAQGIFRYILPVLPHGFLMWVLSVSDRFFLDRLGSNGMAELGLYQFAYVCAGVMQMVVVSANAAWPPVFMDIARHDENASERLGRFGSFAILLLAMIACIGILFSRELIALVAEPHYHASYAFAAVLILAFFFQGVAMFVGMGIWHVGKTHYVVLVSASGATVSVGLNLLLIPRLGAMGACITQVGAYITISLVYFLLSQKYLRLHYSVKPLLVALVLPLSALMTLWIPQEGFLVPLVVKLLAVALILTPVLYLRRTLIKDILSRLK